MGERAARDSRSATCGMSRHLKNASEDDVSGMGTLDVFTQGAKLLGQSISSGGSASGSNFSRGLSHFGGSVSNMSSLLGGSKDKNDVTNEDDAFEDEYDDEEGDDDDDDDIMGSSDEDVAELQVAHDDDDDDEFLENAAEKLFGQTGKDAMDAATGLLFDQYKTFMCDIYNVRVTNIAQRRRDVQVIMTLGAVPNEVAEVVGSEEEEEAEAAEAPKLLGRLFGRAQKDVKAASALDANSSKRKNVFRSDVSACACAGARCGGGWWVVGGGWWVMWWICWV